MILYDIANIVNIIGVTLMLIFYFPWRGRPPRNRTIGIIGFAMIFVAAVTLIVLRFSGGA